MVDTRFRAMPGAPLPDAYTTAGTSSLTDFGRGQAFPGRGGLGDEEPAWARRQVADLAQQVPHGIQVPHATGSPHGATPLGTQASEATVPHGTTGHDGTTAPLGTTVPRSTMAPQGTTVVAVTFDGGVLVAGDRRAISGNVISRRDTATVFVADAYSAVGVTGTAGIAAEMVRTYQSELSRYEKLEGVPLSLPAKTNRLAALVRGNLGAALPLFIGFDLDADDPAMAGWIVSFDEGGGQYEERAGFHGVGTGALFACAALKKLWDQGSDKDAAIRAAIEALCDAADDDAATGGPDLARRIYPNIITITAAEGAVHLPEDELAEVTESVVTARDSRPRG